MAFAPKEDIERIRERISISDLVSSFVQLKTAGAGTKKGLCPFHDEKTPSFTVKESTGSYHCFGCGESGDAFSFIMKMNGLDFGEAVKNLADKAGVSVNWQTGGGFSREDSADKATSRTKIVEINTATQGFFEEQLLSPEAEPARELLKGRQFTPEQCAKFGCGYSPKSWDRLVNYLTSRGFTQQEMKDAGVANLSSRGSMMDMFRGRLMWPIRDVNGDILGFGGRKLFEGEENDKLTGVGKFINTAETRIYKKTKVLYGLDLARGPIQKERVCVVCEGYADVMAMHLSGIETAVASCGTAFGAEHVKIINRLMGVDAVGSGQVQYNSMGKVILVFDGDEAGMKAARKTYAEDQNFAAQAFVVILPDGQDPCDYRKNMGEAALRSAVDNARPLYEFIMETVVAGFDTSPEGRAGRMKALAPIVAGIRDIAIRNNYTRYVMGLTGLPESEVRAEIRSAAASRVARASRTEIAAPNNGFDGGFEESNAHDPEAPATASGFSSATRTLKTSTTLSVPAKFLSICLQHPESVDPDLFFEVEGQIKDQKLDAIYQAMMGLGGTVVGTAIPTSAWVSQVESDVPEYLQKTVRSLSAARLDISDAAKLSSYASELVSLLAKTGLDAQYNELMAQLRMVSASGDTKKQRELMEKVRDIQLRMKRK